MIITVMGGQLFSALVIGMIHSQLQLTSEEAGVSYINACFKINFKNSC